MIRDYTVLDLETTGLKVKEDRIIEIAALRVRDFTVTEQYVSFVNPGRNLSQAVTDLTGICGQDLINAKMPEAAIPKILEFIGDDVLVGHRILFDYSFLKRAAVYYGCSFEKKGIDTLKLSRKYLPDLPSKSLSGLCSYFEIAHTPHRALEDCAATNILYQKLCKLFYDPKDFSPEQLQFKIKKETPATKPQKEQLYKLINKHKLLIDYNVDQLTRNEASRIIDRILSAYGR